MNVRGFLLLVLAIATSLTLTACASAGGRRGERVGGLFDGGESTGGVAYSRHGSGGGESASSTDEDGRDDARPSTREEAVEVTASRPRGLFDFGGADKKSQAPAAAREPPPAPSTVPEPDKPVEVEHKPDIDKKQPEASGPRLVIYKGNLTVMVTVVDASVEKLAARAKELGGYLENQASNGGANNATVTLRVPADKFYDLVNELGSYGQVTQKQISAEDVTKRVFDVELRLDTAEKARARLLDLLKQATKMEEILQIENEARRLTDEIEGMKGELRFLKDQVSLSTLSVTFYSNAPPPTAGPTRTRSRFEWINKVGIEPVLNNF